MEDKKASEQFARLAELAGVEYPTKKIYQYSGGTFEYKLGEHGKFDTGSDDVATVLTWLAKAGYEWEGGWNSPTTYEITLTKEVRSLEEAPEVTKVGKSVSEALFAAVMALELPTKED